MNSFVNLHVQSHYSILRATSTISELVNKTKELQQRTIAITDYNNMFAVPEFYKKCKNENIKPIFGVKIDVMNQSRFSPQRKDDPPISKYTLILLAKNFAGYQNILKIVSFGYDDGSFGRFCVDKTLLKRYSSDIIVLSSDHTGELWYYASTKNIEQLHHTCQFYQETFGIENFYIEIQDRGISEDKIANQVLIEFAKTNQIPLVATNPILYLNAEDNILLEIASCIREKDFLSDNIKSHGCAYFKSTEEIIEQFKEIPESISNTLKIAESCNVIFPKVQDQSPQYPIPKDMTAGEFLREKSFKELTQKFDGNLPPEYAKRLNWELDTVCNMGFPNYFLVVSDFVQYAKKNGIFVGPGRGSAAGALLSYAIDITNVDPLKYDLLFERFLNPERVSMPDIDIDFEDDRRDEVKQYLRTHYGAGKTADVITFGYNKAKAVLKDVGRVLEIPLPRVNQITNLVDANEDLNKQAEKITEIKNILTNGSIKEKQWIGYSIKLANRIRNLGTHASALIVAENTLNTVIPLIKDRSNTITTAFEGKYLEENGLLKMDILGLSNLSIIRDCIHRIYENHQIWIDLNKISLSDEKVFTMFTEGYTAGIFQFESDGMTNYIKQLQPNSIEDLIAMNALYRPGPMDSIPSFIDRKHGKEEIDCFHENLEPILKTTYGIIVYQEQVMQIAQVLSGFSLGEADIVRRIMAKKKPDELETIRPKWIKGAIDQGYEEKLADTLFELLIPFSNYAFNKSHAAAYSILAYQIAWLKVHYPAEFMCSLMSSNMGRHEDLANYITETKKLDIPILMPNINQSFFDFKVETFEEDMQEKIGIRYGLGAIKGLGEQASKEIIKERHWGGNYLSIEDFIERTTENNEIRKVVTEILIKAGAFDSLFNQDHLMLNKAIYLNSENLSILYNKFEKKEKDTAFNLFSTEEMQASTKTIQITNITPLSFEEDFQNEIKVFGFYLTQKLFSVLIKKIGNLSTYTESLQDILPLNSNISLMGYVTDIYIQINPQNKHKSWGKFVLNTQNDNISFFVFGDKLNFVENVLSEGCFVFLKAFISERKNQQRSYEIIDLCLLKEDTKPLYSELNIVLQDNISNHEINPLLLNLKQIAQQDYRNDAHHRINFHLLNGTNMSSLSANTIYRIHFPSPRIQELLNNPIISAYWLS
ncbi:MAG: DNA polymerase III subunit alpha [Spirochaetota bacterium]|nr:DNA polymerase III subunit alpha [Spirochaetota bacterium]